MSDGEGQSPANRIAFGGAAISFASLLVSLAALFYACDAAESGQSQADTARKESDRRGLLEISDVTATVGEVKGKARQEDGSTREVNGLKAPRVDLRVRNRGSGQARIDDVEVTVIRSTKLEGCHGSGGPLSSTANYQVPIPLDQNPPFTRVLPLDFKVGAGEYDRFTLTLGPDDELDIPWVGVVTLRLRSDDGGDLNVGPLGLVAPSDNDTVSLKGNSWLIEPTDNRTCVQRNARTVGAVLRIPNLTVSPALTALERALRR